MPRKKEMEKSENEKYVERTVITGYTVAILDSSLNKLGEENIAGAYPTKEEREVFKEKYKFEKLKYIPVNKTVEHRRMKLADFIANSELVEKSVEN